MEIFNIVELENKFTGENIPFLGDLQEKYGVTNNNRFEIFCKLTDSCYNRQAIKSTITGIGESASRIMDFTVPNFEDVSDTSKNNIRVVSTLTDDLIYKVYYIDNHNIAHCIFQDYEIYGFYFDCDDHWISDEVSTKPILSEKCILVIE